MKTILVVDDFASVRFYHESLLRGAGYATLAARDGAEALDLLRAKTVDLVLLDLLMPRMSGEEFLSKLREHPEKAALPILVITSEGQREEARQLAQRGHCSILNKPVSPDALLAEIRRYIG